MTFRDLVFREARHHAGSFAAGTAAVALAVGAWMAAAVFITGGERGERELLREKEDALRATVGTLRADVQDAMRRIGLTVTILPAGANLEDWYAADFAEATMPESAIDALAAVTSVAHMQPRLLRKVRWPETQWTVLVAGIGKPVQPAPGLAPADAFDIPPGEASIGHELARGLSLAEGGTLTLLGQPFTIRDCRPESGTKDELTIRIALADAQRLFGLPGRINEITAVAVDPVHTSAETIRAELERALPGARVVLTLPALATTTLARLKTAEQAEAAFAAESGSASALLRRKRVFARLSLCLAAAAAALTVCLSTLANARRRRSEAGILASLGLEARLIRRLFLARAALASGTGSVLGLAAGSAIALLRDPAAPLAHALWTGLAAALAISAAATWLPAAWLASTDPATLLRDD